MNSSTRNTIAVLVVIVIALLIWLWARRDAPQPPAKGEIATQPAAPKPEPLPVAPAKPAVEEPLGATVHFDYNRSAVRADDARLLDEFAAKLKDRAYDRLDAVGHADRIGGTAYNLALSRQRAEAVRDYLAGKGVDARRVLTEAKGEAEPVTGEACTNMGRENRNNRKLIDCLQRNRRTEIRLR